MAKKTLTPASYATNNIQSQPDQVKDNASALKLAFDLTGINAKAHTNNTLIAELQSETVNDAGANAIGAEGTFGTNNVADELKAAKTEIDNKADTGDVVTISGTQTVTGEKTFQAIKVPVTPSVNTDPASKKYVDDTAFNGVPLGNPDEFLKTNSAGDGVEYSDLPNTNATNISTNTSNISDNADDIADIQNFNNKLLQATVTGSNGDVTATGITFTDGDKLEVEFDTAITAPSTISFNAGTQYALKDLEGNDIEIEIDKIYVIVFKDDVTDFFAVAPRGGGNKVNGTILYDLKYTTNIEKGDTISVSSTYVSESSLSDPSNLPPGTGQEGAISADGNYAIHTSNVSPYVTFYERTGTTWAKMSDPVGVTFASYARNRMAMSADGQYAIFAQAPDILVLKRSGSTWSKIATLPTVVGESLFYCLDISDDGKYIIGSGAAASNYFFWFKNDGADNYSKLPDPSTFPTARSNSIAINADKTYVILGTDNTAGSLPYQLDEETDTLTSFSGPSMGTSGDTRSISMSSNARYVAFGRQFDSRLRIYKLQGTTWTSYYTANYFTFVNSVDLSPLGEYCLASYGTVTDIYRNTGTTFTNEKQLTLPGTVNAARISAAFANGDNFEVMIAHDLSTFIYFSQINGPTTASKANNQISLLQDKLGGGFANKDGNTNDIKETTIVFT